MSEVFITRRGGGKDPATILNTYRLYRKDITESQNWIVPSNAVGNMFKVYVCGGGGYYCPAGGISEDYRFRYAGGGIGIWDGDTIITSFDLVVMDIIVNILRHLKAVFVLFNITHNIRGANWHPLIILYNLIYSMPFQLALQ